MKLLFISLLIFCVASTHLYAQTRARIGFIAPLTGPRASFGQDGLAAARVALDELKAPIDIVTEDSQGDPRQGVNAYQSLKSRGIRFVLTMNSNVSLPISKLAARDNVIQLAISTTTDAYSTPDDTTFRINGGTIDEARELAKFLTKPQGQQNLALITLEDEYPVNLSKNLLAELSVSQFKLVLNQTFMPKESDFKPLLAKLRAFKADVLVLLSYQTEGGLFMKQLKEQKIPLKRVVGSVPLRNKEFFQTAGEASEGVYISYFAFNENIPAASALKAAGLSINVPTSQGYDGILIANEALKRCGYSTEDVPCLKRAFFGIKNIQGLSGTRSMDSVNGDMHDEYQILVARSGEFRRVDPALEEN